MKRHIAILAAFALGAVSGILVGIGVGGDHGAIPAQNITNAGLARLTTDPDQLCPIVRIIDGDTADVMFEWHGTQKERLRFLQVDTPERGEPGFKEATAALAELIGDQPVRLEFEEPGKPTRGNFGRLLVYVFNSRGQNINVELIRAGWSPYWTKYGPGRFQAEMEAAEAEARAAKRAMWAVTTQSASGS